MKPITIRNQQYYYEVVKSIKPYTIFYPENKQTFLDKFEVNIDIESEVHTKEVVRNMVEYAQIEYLRRKERKLEIERGEII